MAKPGSKERRKKRGDLQQQSANGERQQKAVAAAPLEQNALLTACAG